MNFHNNNNNNIIVLQGALRQVLGIFSIILLLYSVTCLQEGYQLQADL